MTSLTTDEQAIPMLQDYPQETETLLTIADDEANRIFHKLKNEEPSR